MNVTGTLNRSQVIVQTVSVSGLRDRFVLSLTLNRVVTPIQSASMYVFCCLLVYVIIFRTFEWHRSEIKEYLNGAEVNSILL